MRRGSSPILLVPVLLTACSLPRPIRDTDRMDLSPHEGQVVRAQVERAREERAWVAAWNQAVEAGPDRDLLEQIATDTLAAKEDADARRMFAEIRDVWGGLSSRARQRVVEARERAERDDDWERAVEIELIAADDAPRFAAAWEVYARAPASRAPDGLDAIRKERERLRATGESAD